MKTELTAERVNELLSYDKDTGVFTRRVMRGGAGSCSVAGTAHHTGYLNITIDGRKYLAHRLAWLVTHGIMPKDHIDHINGVRNDNRIINLRDASRSENLCNRGATINNTSGFNGVGWHGAAQKWQAQIKLHGKNKYLGLYTTPELAHAAYCIAASVLHGTFVNHGTSQ